jgi:hypothetical protein
MMLSPTFLHSAPSALAFFQSTQLNLFERFLTQAVSGIDSTGITSGMQNVAYVVLLVGFLWQVYQSALHGGDVRGLGTNLIKYVVTAVVVMNYGAIFTTLNQGFVNAGNWVGNASGGGNLLDNWRTDIQTQFNQSGTQQLWDLVTGAIPALIDGILIIVAYLLYPIVVVIFGFFYIFYGSVLYIFGPIVIALMPLGATNRIAKSYVENVFIWNAWPILYGGFGALLGAVQMGQVSQMLSQNDFLGALGNLEGSFLIGIASIVYSLAIAVIPFIAKRIVSGDVGATARDLAGAAATALIAGVAAGEGVAAGVAAGAGAGSGGTTTAGANGSTPAAAAGSRATATGAGNNHPAPAQGGPDRLAMQSGSTRTSNAIGESNAPDAPNGSRVRQESGEAGTTLQGDTNTTDESSPTAEGDAEFIRSNLGAAIMPEASKKTSANSGAPSTDSRAANSTASSSASRSGGSSGRGRSSPRPSTALSHRHGIATWGAYHAARLATRGVVAGSRAVGSAGSAAVDAIQHPVDTAGDVGSSAGRAAGSVVNAATNAARAARSVIHTVSNPAEPVQKGASTIKDAVTSAASQVTTTAKETVDAAREGFSRSYEQTRRNNEGNANDNPEE